MAFRGGSGGRGTFKVNLDFLALGLIIVAGFIFVFSGLAPDTAALGTFLASFLALMLVLMVLLNRKVPWSGNASRAEGQLITKWFLASLVTVLASSAFVSNFPKNLAQVAGVPLVAIGGVSNATIQLLVPAPEEAGFRGVAAPYLANAFGYWGGSALAAILFMIYHFFVYGDNPDALIVVLAAGFVFALAALRTQRLSVTLAAHETNNFLALGFPAANAWVPKTDPNFSGAMQVAHFLAPHVLPYVVVILHGFCY